MITKKLKWVLWKRQDQRRFPWKDTLGRSWRETEAPSILRSGTRVFRAVEQIGQRSECENWQWLFNEIESVKVIELYVRQHAKLLIYVPRSSKVFIWIEYLNSQQNCQPVKYGVIIRCDEEECSCSYISSLSYHGDGLCSPKLKINWSLPSKLEWAHYVAVSTYSGCNLTAVLQCLSKWHLTYSKKKKKKNWDSKPEVSGSMSRYFIETKKAIKQSKPTIKKSLTAKINGLLRAAFSVVLRFSVLPSQMCILSETVKPHGETHGVFISEPLYTGFTIFHCV